MQALAMYGAEALTTFVYGFILLSLTAAFSFAAYLMVQQKRKLQRLEQQGYRPHSVQEGIIAAQRAEEADAKRSRR